MGHTQQIDPVAVAIKTKLDEKGLKHKSIATKAGYTVQQFSAMMNNRKVIKACDLLRIAEAMNVEIPELLIGCPTCDSTEGGAACNVTPRVCK